MSRRVPLSPGTPELLAETAACRARVGPLRRLFQQLFMGELDYWRGYQGEAAQGHLFLAIRAPDGAQARHLQSSLASFQTRAMRYYGLWTITDLPLDRRTHSRDGG